MAKKRRRASGGDSRYFIKFGAAALVLVAGTLVLVLGVLPQRYILSSGFRESGQVFPDPRIPFVPNAPIPVTALPTATSDTAAIPIGPAEAFWAEVMPLLEAGQYTTALPIFERYLLDQSSDDDVRREFALTLIAADRAGEAVPVLDRLVIRQDDDQLRLILARTLRDLGRVDSASDHYRRLYPGAADQVALALEWGQALAWVGDYDGAANVFSIGLRDHPDDIALQVELARVYYFADRLTEASAILEGLSDDELRAHDGLELREGVRTALYVPPDSSELVPPTLLERAVAAREEDDFETARMLFEMALLESPEDAAVWLEYANFLEYELSDFEGARAALLEVERYGEPNAQVQFRLALLEAWVGENDASRDRLQNLLTDLESGAIDPGADTTLAAVTAPEVHALLGDLARWNGDRLGAAQAYQMALADDPTNRRALDGIDALTFEVQLLVEQVEGPRMGSRAYGVGDTDDFGRFDAAVEWIGVRDRWVWNGAAGSRWLSGRDLTGSSASLQGAFVEVNPARWWRWGTIRTSAHLGAQWVGAGDADVSFGAALQYRPLGGSILDLEYRHEPSYGTTGTLQSLYAETSLDRFHAAFSRRLGDVWSIAVQADVTLLDPVALTGADRATRLQSALSLGRTMSQSWTLGWSALAMRYDDAAPMAGPFRLFWDPSAVFSTGPYSELRGRLASQWEGSLRVTPALALIDERTGGGLQTVPQLGVEARLEYQGPSFRSAMDLFYSQARLDGYRTYGVRFSVSTGSWLSLEPGQ